ncbi:hypothetical protein D3C80_1712720 [compost metagenome]
MGPIYIGLVRFAPDISVNIYNAEPSRTDHINPRELTEICRVRLTLIYGFPEQIHSLSFPAAFCTRRLVLLLLNGLFTVGGNVFSFYITCITAAHLHIQPVFIFIISIPDPHNSPWRHVRYDRRMNGCFTPQRLGAVIRFPFDSADWHTLSGSH